MKLDLKAGCFTTAALMLLGACTAETPTENAETSSTTSETSEAKATTSASTNESTSKTDSTNDTGTTDSSDKNETPALSKANLDCAPERLVLGEGADLLGENGKVALELHGGHALGICSKAGDYYRYVYTDEDEGTCAGAFDNLEDHCVVGWIDRELNVGPCVWEGVIVQDDEVKGFNEPNGEEILVIEKNTGVNKCGTRDGWYGYARQSSEAPLTCSGKELSNLKSCMIFWTPEQITTVNAA